MTTLLPLLLVAGLASVQEEEDLTLHDPATGATLTLPQDWAFVKSEGALTAFSEDKRGFVLLAAAEQDFQELREDVKALILSRLDDVVVAKTQIVGVNELGSIEEIVEVYGEGTSRLDGELVEFAGHLVRSGESGVLVLGAWKDEAHAKIAAEILAGLHIKETAGEAGLEITNAATGTSVKIPAGWEVVRSRKGLLANCPHGKAMAILMTWQKDFDQSLERMRTLLMGWVFKEVEIGEFGVVEASYDKSLGRVVVASGTAVDVVDDKPVTLAVLRVQLVDKNEGAALFGAWKDEKHAEEVEALMASIRVKKLEKKDSEKDQ